ncbi:MAG: hypothetical protein H7X99_09415 [Saprospiraceae bacterium]|nr:hypothetical protein [Saprospiraceae bacterium]
MIKIDFDTQLIEKISKTRKNYFNIPIHILSHKSSPEVWSKREILGHLIDSARYNLMRFTEIVSSDVIYEVKSYNQDDQVKLNNYQSQDDYHLITLWQLLNHQIAVLISKLNTMDLSRNIKVKEDIKTLAWLVRDYVEHMQHHLDQIFSSDADISETPVIVPWSAAINSLVQMKAKEGKEFTLMMHYSDLEIEYYKPDKTDKQKPHLKDEVYVIAAGSGSFLVNDQIIPFEAHDVLFVKAGDTHRFIDFTDDFAAWVVFYGVKNCNG